MPGVMPGVQRAIFASAPVSAALFLQAASPGLLVAVALLHTERGKMETTSFSVAVPSGSS